MLHCIDPLSGAALIMAAWVVTKTLDEALNSFVERNIRSAVEPAS